MNTTQETYTIQKRRIQYKRDLYNTKETKTRGHEIRNPQHKRPIQYKRDVYNTKETYTIQKRPKREDMK